MAQFSLGPFNFIRLHNLENPAGTPGGLQTVTAITQRPAVDGTGIFDLGKKGRPFQMESLVDVGSKTAGHNLVQLYRQAIFAAKYVLVYDGIDQESAYDVDYVVLDIERPRVKRIGAYVGGLNNNSTHLVYCVWILQPVQK